MRCAHLLLTAFLAAAAGCAAPGRSAAPAVAPVRPAIWLVDFYRGPLDHLQAVRSGSCPMHPSCSAYAREAVRRHGFAAGWVMAMDRWMRCGRDETRHAPPILVGGQWKIFDPLEANDFWWRPNGPP